ncbi:unnamed protein product [Aphanomyces euteiches]
MKAMRIACLRHIVYQDMSWFDTANAGELASRISGDTVKIKEGMGEKLGYSVRLVCQLLVSFLIGFYRGWNIALVMCAVMPFMAYSLSLLVKTLADLSAKTQSAYAAAGSVAEENLGAMRTVASLNGEERVQSEYNASVHRAQDEAIAICRFLSLCVGSFFMFQWLTYAIGMWYGGKLVAHQNGTVHNPGTVFTAFYLILNATLALAHLATNLSAVATAYGAAKGLFVILDRQSDIDASDVNDGIIPKTCAGKVEARDVRFAYPSRPDDPILCGYSLTIESGETVALVGASGSGKSTLVSLLERFYEPSSGAIFLDGHDIKTLQIQWLRRQIGLVSQEPVLFATTIFENIAAGATDVSKDDVIAAAKLAYAHDFISKLPQGYDTMCGEKGALLSGGQKQRIAIARALVRQPKILILDEATSALDNESERVVQDALNNLMTQTSMTTIVIAHRLSTVRSADKIAVLVQGAVVEMGTHDMPMAIPDGHYRTMVELQSGNAGDDDPVDVEGPVAPKKQVQAAIIKQIPGLDGAAVAATTTPSDDGETAEVEQYIVRRIFELSKPERTYFIAGLVAWISLIVSQVISSMTKYYTLFVAATAHDGEGNPQHYLDEMYTNVSRISIGFGAVSVFMGIVWFVQIYSFRIIAEQLTARLRSLHFEAMCRQDMGFFDQPGHSTGALTADLSTQATKVVMMAGENQSRILQSVFMVLAAFVIGFVWGSWQLTLILMVLFPLLLLGMIHGHSSMRGEAFADNLAESGALATEVISNARTVAAFGLEESFLAKYDHVLDTPLKEGTREAKANGLINAITTLAGYSMNGIVFYYGGYLVHHGAIDFTQLIRSLMAIMMASIGVGETAGFIGDTTAAKHAAASIFKVVDRKPAVAADGAKLMDLSGDIQFQDVSFHYPTRPNVVVLQRCSFSIQPGTTVAFCGPSGGGKSTIVALLERFYNPTAGKITLDGHDIATLQVRWLRNQIGLVGQEPVLFSGSIADNIAHGIADSRWTNEEVQTRVQAAARKANAHAFITQFPQGYATPVGTKGSQLSGGQKQRIAIARAILKDPTILLLDEATSALDVESEKVVQDALDSLLAEKGRTTIVIAHRLSTIRNADKICVMSGGAVAEQGTHDELVARGGIYSTLISSTE